MSQKWHTKDSDLQAALIIMEDYATKRDSNVLGLFEIEVNQNKKSMNYCLSGWVVLIAKHFSALYGDVQGDFVTRQIISTCIIRDQTLH
ncbi:MAG: hypothetical protein H0U75_11325 [Legionella sp.]|nr:hypothetical protein [Legionella sp.]